MNRTLLILAFPVIFTLSASNIGYLYPAGGKRGTTVQVIVGGQQLWGIHTALISGKGVKVLSCKSAPGKFYAGSGEQSKWIRDWMRRIYAGNPEKLPKPEKNLDVWRVNPFYEQLDTLDPLMLSLACRGIYMQVNSLQMSPAIASKMVLTIEIAPDAQPGCRELRLASRPNNLYVSNPLRFYVGAVPEFQEELYPHPPLKRQPVRFTIPGVINGQIEPGEVDSFKFTRKRGERATFITKARILNPFIGDGVPGHFQAILEVQDSSGKVLKLADDNYFDPDPVLEFIAPADGVYTLVIRDALYRGREDFVYRIDVTDKPYRRPALIAPKLPIPLVKEEALQGKVLQGNALISCVIPAPKAEKSFRFAAKAGEMKAVEIFARRLGSPLDSLLKIYDSRGKLLAVNDDVKRPNVGLIVQHTDSYLCFKAPENGVYTVKVSDTSGAGGADYRCFLRIDRLRPDFSVTAGTSALHVSMDSGADPLLFVVEKKDGFDGEIRFELAKQKNLRLTGINTLPKGADSGQLTFSASWQRKCELLAPKLYAVCGKIRHEVKGADPAMQAFAYTHYIPAEKLNFSHCWLHGSSDRFRLPPKFNYRVKVKRGKSVTLPVTFLPHKNLPDAKVSFQLQNPPKGVTMECKQKGDVYNLTIKAAPDTPQCAVNQLILRVLDTKAKPGKDGKERRNISKGHLPAIRLEVE